MKFSDENDVRKWLRSIPLKKKELMLKIDFYAELKTGIETRRAKLAAASRGKSESGSERDGKVSKSISKIVSVAFYEEQMEMLRRELDSSLTEFERLTEPLESIEKTIVSMKYLRKMSWTAIAMQTSYSERQAQRILKHALKKIRETANREAD